MASSTGQADRGTGTDVDESALRRAPLVLDALRTVRPTRWRASPDRWAHGGVDKKAVIGLDVGY